MRTSQLRDLLRQLAEAPNLRGVRGTIRAGDIAIFASNGRLNARLSADRVEPVITNDDGTPRERVRRAPRQLDT